MGRLHKLLDPMQTGPEAGKLDSNLRKRIVGQDDAIQQIVDVYQTYLAGMSNPGRPIGNFLFSEIARGSSLLSVCTHGGARFPQR